MEGQAAVVGARRDAVLRSMSDAVIAHLRLQNPETLEMLRSMAGSRPITLVVDITGSQGSAHVVAIVRLVRSEMVRRSSNHLQAGAQPSTSDDRGGPTDRADCTPAEWSAHASARWARAVVPLIDSPNDPRTIENWSRWIAASPGAVRNWCHTAGINPRRSLVFGRLLRAVVLSDGGRHKPENVLDVVDRRTLAAMLRLAGLTIEKPLPEDLDDFLERQTLIADPDTLTEVRRAIQKHRNRAAGADCRTAGSDFSNRQLLRKLG